MKTGNSFEPCTELKNVKVSDVKRLYSLRKRIGLMKKNKNFQTKKNTNFPQLNFFTLMNVMFLYMKLT